MLAIGGVHQQIGFALAGIAGHGDLAFIFTHGDAHNDPLNIDVQQQAAVLRIVHIDMLPFVGSVQLIFAFIQDDLAVSAGNLMGVPSGRFDAKQ